MRAISKKNAVGAHSGGVVLLLGWDPAANVENRVVDGVRRHAKTRDWRIVIANAGTVADAGGLPDLLARVRPVGCIVLDQNEDASIPPRLLGGLPVVYFDSGARVRWRGVASVRCDNAAVARLAYQELSAGLPRSYAAVPTQSMRRWNAERIAAFRALCAADGKPCVAFAGRRGEDPDRRLARLRRWVAKLPRKCAVFAANDNTAVDVAAALAANGRSVPRDNTIVGVDGGERATCGGDVSALSSVKIDREQSGYLAARLLDSEIDRHSRAAADCRAGVGGGAPRIAAASPSEELFGPLLVVRRRSTCGSGRREPRILEAVEMIRREACEGLSAAVLAARFPGSRNLFERRFREAMGHSVLDEILHVRLQRVLDLLSRPDMPISAIAAFSGFSSDRELRQLFLRRFRCSMRQWRVRHSPRER